MKYIIFNWKSYLNLKESVKLSKIISGFKNDNPLRGMGDFNFYVSSPSYGPVEIIHLSICHCICDAIIHEKSKTSDSLGFEKENN